MRRRFVIVILMLLASAALAQTASGSGTPPAPPLGTPIPTDPTVSDLLATSTLGGDAGGLLPGARACSSAPHQPLSLRADDAPHNHSTYIEFWWWTGHLVTADGR